MLENTVQKVKTISISFLYFYVKWLSNNMNFWDRLGIKNIDLLLRIYRTLIISQDYRTDHVSKWEVWIKQIVYIFMGQKYTISSTGNQIFWKTVPNRVKNWNVTLCISSNQSNRNFCSKYILLSSYNLYGSSQLYFKHRVSKYFS